MILEEVKINSINKNGHPIALKLKEEGKTTQPPLSVVIHLIA